MEKRNRFLTFIAALIPGVGYMYLGLVKKGVQTLVLFLFAKHFFPLLGIDFFGDIILVPFWFYTFFDTFNIASKINRGEQVDDSELVFPKYKDSGFTINHLSNDRKFFSLLAWALIFLGTLAIVSRMLEGSFFYQLVMPYFKVYFFPVLLILGGVYLLIKEDKIQKE